jgi:hypothetical protein
VTHVRKVLIEKRTAQAVTGVREECIDVSASRRGPQPIDTVYGGQIDFKGRDVGAESAKPVSRALNLWSIGSHEQVVPFLGADCGQLESDTRRGPCDNGEWFIH